MSEESKIQDMMVAYAQDAVDLARERFQLTLDYSEQSIETVESILGRYEESIPRSFFQRLFRESPTPENIDQVCKMFGAYIGEVMRRKVAANWDFDGQTVPGKRVVSLEGNGGRVWPTMKVHKRIMNGTQDNVWHYFQAVVEHWNETA